MEDLVKIHHVLTLKRSTLERDIAVSQAGIRKLAEQIEVLETRKQEMTNSVFGGDSSVNIATDIVALEKWKQNTDKKIEGILAWKQKEETALLAQKQTLKEILVKQDIIKTQLEASRKSAAEAQQDANAETRLEGWVTTHLG